MIFHNFAGFPSAGSLTVDSSRPLPTKARLDYTQSLQIWSDQNKTIIIVYTDTSAVEMVFNFIEVSILPHRIQNILVVGESQQTCLKLEYLGIPCFVIYSDFKNTKPDFAADYSDPAFISKMNIRIDVISDAISLGYTVLHSDADIIYLKNPFHYINCGVSCDVAALWDSVILNAGFIYVKPTTGAKWLYSEMKAFAQQHPQVNDQVNLHNNVNKGQNQGKLNCVVLDRETFLSGTAYFEPDNHFAGNSNCSKCVVVHNNWIVGLSSKVYRLQEHLMWRYDGDQYYSNPKQMYLYYSNPHYFTDRDSFLEEVSALKNAFIIGEILNRIVILPKFHCDLTKPIQCSLLSRIRLSVFHKCLLGKYREHMFLSNPKVPLQYTESLNDNPTEMFISNPVLSSKNITSKTKKMKVFYPFNEGEGPKEREVLKWFGGMTESVIKFHSLYGSIINFDSPEKENNFKVNLLAAFKSSDYRQLN